MRIIINESVLEDHVKAEVKAEIIYRQGDPQTIEDWIADFFSHKGKITPNSFKKNLDRNWFIEKLNFISSNGTPLDVAAMTISNHSGMQIEDSDIVEFIREYKSATDYWNTVAKNLIADKIYYYSQELSHEALN